MTIDNHAIMSRALRHGFTLRQQPSGDMDLNPYVYDLCREMFEAGRMAARTELLPELEKARTKAATAEKWQGLALARNGDGRTVQEIQRDAGEEFRLLLRDIYDVALGRRIHHRNRGDCPEPATGNLHWRDDECPACQVLMRAAAALCDTRNGRGEIGGFHGGAAPGYVTEPCPDCVGAQHERQDARDDLDGGDSLEEIMQRDADEAEAIRRDAKRYRSLRRGQKWSVIDGIGSDLRADDLDAAIDAEMQSTEAGGCNG